MNKSNISQSHPALSLEENPEEKRRKEINGLMKRFGELLDPAGYDPSESILEEETQGIDRTPLRQLLRRRDRVKNAIEHKMYCKGWVK